MFLKEGTDPLNVDGQGNTFLMTAANPYTEKRKAYPNKDFKIHDLVRLQRRNAPSNRYPLLYPLELECLIYKKDTPDNVNLSVFDGTGLKGLLKIPLVRDNIDVRNLKGETALFLTAKIGQLEKFGYVIERGSRPSYSQQRGQNSIRNVSTRVNMSSRKFLSK